MKCIDEIKSLDDNIQENPVRYIEDLQKDKQIDSFLRITKNEKQKLNRILENMNTIKQQNEIIKVQNEINYLKNELYLQNIKNMHNETMRYINSLGIYIWTNYSISQIYYRINAFSKKEKIKTHDDLYVLVKTNIRVYDNMEKVKMCDNTLLLVKNLLLRCKDDLFFPDSSKEFININQYMYKNTFQYSSFLYKRVSEKQIFQSTQKVLPPLEELVPIDKELSDASNSYIFDFLNLMIPNENEVIYIFKWLSLFFQTMKKTETALVLIGDIEVSNILIEQIIRPIFAYKKEYFGRIDDSTLKKPNEIIIKDKIFYHIGELSRENCMNKNTSRLVIDILKRNQYSHIHAIENNEIYSLGQLIVTAEKETPYPFLKDSYSQCRVFRISHIDTILKKLDVDRITFDSLIHDDLEKFSNQLAQEYLGDMELYRITDTEEKNALPTMKNGILMTSGLKKNIENFIKNIKEKKLRYFINIQEEKNMYEELIHNFEENMISQPLLSQYFNLIYGDTIFAENTHLLEILKEKSEMFNKAPDDKSKYNGKKRYTII
jgi:hypothetical protein